MQVKYDNLIFIFLLAVIVIGISLAIAQPPDPGHDASSIGPGIFGSGGDYIFPAGSTVEIEGTLDIKSTQMYVGNSMIGSTFRILGDHTTGVWLQAGAERSSGSVKDITFSGMYGTPVHMRIKDDGKVGIGTTSPGQKLHVEGGNILASDTGAGKNTFISKNAFINTYSSGADTYFYPRTWSMTGAKFGFKPNAAYIDSYLDNRPASLTPGPIEFKTGGTTQMIVAADGNVGINTTTPTATLDVAGSLKVGGGTAMNEIQYGTIGDCTDNSAGNSGTVTFPSAFSNTPIVILTPDESADNSGCSSVRLTARSTTGFSWNSWVGSSPVTCDCIHWLAIG